MHHRATRGFTLLELMAAVAVLGVLLAVGVPSFGNIIRKNRMATHTNALVSALAVARSEAVKRSDPVTVCSTDAAQAACILGWSNGWIMFTDGGAPGTVDPTDVILQRWSAPLDDGIGVTAPFAFVRFLRDGRPHSAGNFKLMPPICHDRDARVVSLSAAGRVAARPELCP
jgi:type IV fimbrial biogenesis protein FimT